MRYKVMVKGSICTLREVNASNEEEAIEIAIQDVDEQLGSSSHLVDYLEGEIHKEGESNGQIYQIQYSR